MRTIQPTKIENAFRMKKIVISICLIFFSTLIKAQETPQVLPFDHILNQFQNVRDFSISEDGNEAFFTVQSPSQEISQLAYIKKIKDKWIKPQLLEFNDSYMYLEPFLADDGKRLYFVSDRPLNDSDQRKKDFDIWYVERKDKNSLWSKPINIGKPINTEMNEFYPSLSDNGNLYFTMESPKGLGKDDIYFSKWNGKNYEEPILLNENINSIGYEFNSFISKKEDFILFTKYNEKDGQGSGDLYVSKRDSNGKWLKAMNLGIPINTKYMEYCPFYDEKSQTLYFTSKRNNIKPKKFKNITDLQQYISESENGLSKIYQTLLKIE